MTTITPISAPPQGARPLDLTVLFMDGKDVVAAVTLAGGSAQQPAALDREGYAKWWKEVVDRAATVVAEQWSIENAERVARGEDDPQVYTPDSVWAGLRVEVTWAYRA